MAEMLTPQQQMAVCDRGGKLLVSAAAGSGKTKVLVDRVLSYLTDPVHPANLDEFLIITYTKAAASELRGKIAAKLSERIALDPGNRHLQQQMQRLYLTKISTVHAFCGDILREYAYTCNLPADFRVADDNECTELQMQVLDDLLESAYQDSEVDSDFLEFVNTQGLGRDDRLIPQIILQVYNSSRCHLDPEAWLDWCCRSAETDSITDAGMTLWGAYLIDDLKKYLHLQIEALNRCVDAAAKCDGMVKPAQLLQATVLQLQALLRAETWDQIVEAGKIDFGRLTFSKNCDEEVAARIKSVRAACKAGVENKLRSFTSTSVQVLSDLAASAAAARGLICLVRKFTKLYSVKKQQRRVLDFGDLEHKALDLILGKKRSGPTALAMQIGERFREIMVDEYQDSNSVQDAIFGGLTQKRQNCFMVGDVKQSIYQFRLADPDIFIQKYNAYADAGQAQVGEGRKVLLCSNFRSSGGVIEAVNDVFATCMSEEVGGLAYGPQEMLQEGIPHIPLSEPEVSLYGIDVREDTYAEEAAFVAEKIQQLLDGKHMVRHGDTLRPARPEDVVILLRAYKSSSSTFACALEQRGIACTAGGSIGLLQTEEVTVLHSLLQIISNPLQDIPLLSVLASRIIGFTADELAVVRGKSRRASLYERLSKQTDAKSTAFMKMLNALRQDARLYSLTQLLQKVFYRTSIDSLYAALPDGPERNRNLQQFCQLATEFEASGRRDLDQFLEHISALETKGQIDSAQKSSAGAVSIMSIHKSKGLEFPIVFLCGLSRRFNTDVLREKVLCQKNLGLGLCCVDTKNRVRYPTIAKKAIAVKMISDSISEEMRVLYVAMTRAKDRLIMTYAAKNIGSDLQDIALRWDYSGKLLMTSQVSCPGEWVLQTAMQRIEAGAFFRVAGRPDFLKIQEPVWRIDIVAAPEAVTGESVASREERHLTEDTVERLKKSLSYRYPYILSTDTPSKLTATELKGRVKDQEAAEQADTVGRSDRVFRRFHKSKEDTPEKALGNAFHAVMQYIRYQNCHSLQGIQQELQRLALEGIISPDQYEAVMPEKIAALFQSPLGRKLCKTEQVLREFKFSILDDWGQYDSQLAGEKVLLQGVVDCAIIESDGITVIDFKTDRVTVATIAQVVEKYHPQVSVYAKALERIYQTKVKKKYLYLFSLDCFVEVTD